MENKLPKNWVETEIGAVGEVITGNTPSKKHPEYYDGEVPWIKPGDIRTGIELFDSVEKLTEEGARNARLLPKGAVMVTCIGNLGNVAIAGTKMATNQQINSVVFDNNINDKFGYYACNLLKPWLIENSTSTTISMVNKSIFQKAPFPLPPLAEQQRIVAKLDDLFGHLDTLKTRLNNIPQLLKNFRQAVLSQAVKGKLTEEWRKGKELDDVDLYLERIYEKRNDYYLNVEKEYSKKDLKAPRKPSQSILEGSNIPIAIPNSWKEVRLADLIVDLTDYHANGSYVKLKANVTLKEEEDYACMIRSTNFEKNNFEDLLIYINEEAYNFMHKSKLFGGEILISKIGNAGSVYLMPNLNRPASLAMNLFALRINELVDNKFLYYYLISNLGSKLINKYVRGVATKSIDKISVRSVMIGLPSLEEQTEIVKRIEHLFTKADAIEDQYQTLKTKIDSLPQAILAKAFKGELVEQLDSDGDAKELLEEIKSLRESMTKQSVKRKKKKK